MWHSINCSDRILHWRDWRNKLQLLDFESALHKIAQDWAAAPRINHYLAPDEVTRWPTPWELINDNYYCDLSICLGMYYTIMLSKHNTDHLATINIYRDDVAQSWYNLCSIDSGKYVLNWDQGRIVNITTLPITAKLIYQYKQIDLAPQLGLN